MEKERDRSRSSIHLMKFCVGFCCPPHFLHSSLMSPTSVSPPPLPSTHIFPSRLPSPPNGCRFMASSSSLSSCLPVSSSCRLNGQLSQTALLYEVTSGNVSLMPIMAAKHGYVPPPTPANHLVSNWTESISLSRRMGEIFPTESSLLHPSV